MRPSAICPALMLAASRNERVIGRSRILMDSTKAKNGFNQSGAPPGRIPAMNLVGDQMIDEIIRLSHRGIANDIVINRCLVFLKTYGKRPRMFMEIIRINAEDRINERPFKCLPVVRVTWEFIISFGKVKI